MTNYSATFDRNKDQFLTWEAATRDTIDFKKLYVDIADDLIAGVLLSQIVFWFLPNKHGDSKLRVNKEGHQWLVRGRDDWWEECRIKPRQYDSAIKKLVGRGVIATSIFKFNGETKIHIRIVWEKFLDLQNTILNPPETAHETPETLDTIGINESVNRDLHVNRESRIGESGITDRGIALTEIVTEISSLNECMNEDDDPDIPILKILNKKLNLKNNGINIAEVYSAEIFMTIKQVFIRQSRNSEIVSIACDLFLEEYVKANRLGDFALKNPVGWFVEQYKKAISKYKAQNYQLQKEEKNVEV